MNWKLIVSLSLFGILMGVPSVFGLTRGIEWLLWLVVALICASVLSRYLQTKYFPTALFVGLISSVLNGMIQSAFLDTYLAHNAEVAEGFGQIPGGVSPRIFILVSSVVIGCIYGVVLGLFTLLGKKFIKPPRAQASEQ